MSNQTQALSSVRLRSDIQNRRLLQFWWVVNSLKQHVQEVENKGRGDTVLIVVSLWRLLNQIFIISVSLPLLRLRFKGYFHH